jgi:hypothetical protein
LNGLGELPIDRVNLGGFQEDGNLKSIVDAEVMNGHSIPELI